MKSNAVKAKFRTDKAGSAVDEDSLEYLDVTNDYNRYRKKLGGPGKLQKIPEKNDSDVASNPSKIRQSLIYLGTEPNS